MDTNKNRAIGAELKSMRTQVGITQVEVARRLKKPQSYVSKLESGERSLRVAEVFDYAQALGTPVNDFMGRINVSITNYHRQNKDAR
jgi:transcriptional regulator with XRE-family HTH domain